MRSASPAAANAIREPLWTRGFVAVCGSSFFLFLIFYILAVALPLFVTGELHTGQETVGLVMTSFVVAAVVFRPLAGKWLDHYDKKKLLTVSLLLFFVCTAVYPFIRDFWWLIALRFVHGIGFGIAATAGGAIAAQLSPASRKGEGIGYFGLFMSLAMVVGPAVGLAVLRRYDSGALFAMLIVFGALALVFGLLLRMPAPRGGAARGSEARGWRAYLEPAAIPVSIAGAILAFAYGSITTFLSVYANDLGLGDYASVFFVLFAAMIVLSRPFTGKLFDTRGPNALVYPGLALFVVGMIVLSEAYAAPTFLVSAAIIGLGYGALLPSFQTLAVQSAPVSRAGLATATFFVFFDSGYGAGSYALGLVASRWGYHGMYVAAGIAAAFAAVAYFASARRKRKLQANG